MHGPNLGEGQPVHTGARLRGPSGESTARNRASRGGSGRRRGVTPTLLKGGTAAWQVLISTHREIPSTPTIDVEYRVETGRTCTSAEARDYDFRSCVVQRNREMMSDLAPGSSWTTCIRDVAAVSRPSASILACYSVSLHKSGSKTNSGESINAWNESTGSRSAHLVLAASHPPFAHVSRGVLQE